MPAIKYLAHLLIAVAALLLAAAATSADAQRVSAGESAGYASSGTAVPSAMPAAQGGEIV
jgi:hypothetical protein